MNQHELNIFPSTSKLIKNDILHNINLNELSHKCHSGLDPESKTSILAKKDAEINSA